VFGTEQHGLQIQTEYGMELLGLMVLKLSCDIIDLQWQTFGINPHGFVLGLKIVFV
jgi:hypothetical protein